MADGLPSTQQKRSLTRRQNYLWIALLSGLALIWLSNGFGSATPYLAFFVVTCCITLTATRPSKRISSAVILLLIGFLLLLAIPNCGQSITIAWNNNNLRLILTRIRSENLRYELDHGSYAPSIEELLADEQKYVPGFGSTPYTWQRREHQVPWLDPICAHPVNETGWPANVDQLAGDFVYIPHSERSDDEQVTTGFDLIGFGWPAQTTMHDRLFPIKVALPVQHITEEKEKIR